MKKGFKKNGDPAKPKKDGTARIAGGGYSEKKQRLWCEGVLDRAVALAKELFGKAADIVVARYAAVDCGYEGCRRLFQKKHGLPQTRVLVREAVRRLAESVLFRKKYEYFKKNIELANFNQIFWAKN